MKARMRAYSADGQTLLGTLPTWNLTWSIEVGGEGVATFQTTNSALDSLGARDSVLILEFYVGSSWVPVFPYALRPPFSRAKVGGQRVNCTARSLLAQWSLETRILPEYTVGDMPRGAGTDRVLGWPSTFYSPAADAAEAWSGCYETSRVTMPSRSIETDQPWPSGTGATWISITGATDNTERKFFRTADASPLTISTAGPIRVFVASDSPGKFYVAGEPVIYVDGGEPGKEPILFNQIDMWVEPGDYACAYDTMSIWDTGGDGVDPFIAAICTLDADGDPDVWLLVTNDTDWVACRRNDQPPGNEPPGPTCGQMTAALVAEAQERLCSGWPEVTLGFTGSLDSYGDAWSEVVVERNVRYGSDSYWAIFNMLGETDECDVWMDPDLTLQAANAQGEDRTGTVNLTSADIGTFSDVQQPDAGTWVCALAHDGWADAQESGAIRREYNLEVGTAISRAVIDRIAQAALAENGRWDGTVKLRPSSGFVPMVDAFPGDRVAISYSGAPATARILSFSGVNSPAAGITVELTD